MANKDKKKKAAVAKKKAAGRKKSAVAKKKSVGRKKSAVTKKKSAVTKKKSAARKKSAKAKGKKVVILGGGVGGLSAAQELAERGYEVEVYESRPVLFGGKARSMGDPGTGTDGRQDLPGEHGFRFFPGFYRNLPDTMKRIPTEGGTVYDNLVATTVIEMSRTNGPPIIVPANYPEGLQEWVAALFELSTVLHSGITPEEGLFFIGRMFQILTSCHERRLQEYEKRSWWDFIGAADASHAYQTILAEGLTRSLVASQPRVADARTVGDIMVQLILDAVTPGVRTDRVLNAPTNDAWIFPWLSYLQSMGVKLFNNHVVTELKHTTLKHNVAQITGAVVEVNGKPKTAKIVTGDYYVSAMPVGPMRTLLNNSNKLKDAAPSLQNLDKLTTARMNGIQFYLNVDVPIDHGHCIYLDSAWALTSISQHQFWENVELSQYGNGMVKGVISVDVSNWKQPGKYNKKMAIDCSAEEIKKEVWAELKDSLNRTGKKVLKDSQLVGWHLDPDITFPRSPTSGKVGDEEPLLVNRKNDAQYRPEATIEEIPNLFLASDYVNTAVHLATMEGANEAARMAVNGILHRTNYIGAPGFCKVYPLEEPPFFVKLQKLDKKRFKKGEPWSPNFSTKKSVE